MRTTGSQYIADDRLITEGAGELHGFVFDCDTDGGVFALYDGLDSGSGRLLFHVEGLANDPNEVMFTVPVRFETGLYVTLDANVSDATVIYEPRRSYSPPTVESIAQAIRDLVS